MSVAANLLTRTQAVELLGSEWVFDELRKRRKLVPACQRPGRYRGHRQPLFRRTDVERQQRLRQQPGPEWLTVAEALSEFPFAKKTLYRWVASDCLMLGRAVRHQQVASVLYLAREDLERCQALRRNPLSATLPEREGRWVRSGVWEDRSGVHWTGAFIQRQHGLYDATLRYWTAHPCPGLDGARLDNSLRAPLPASRNPHGGEVVVYPADQIQRILADRRAAANRVTGNSAWVEEDVWQDEGGRWVTNPWIQRTYNVSEGLANRWTGRQHPALDPAVNGGKLRRKRACRPYRAGQTRRGVWVYAEQDVRRIIAHRKPPRVMGNAEQKPLEIAAAVPIPDPKVSQGTLPSDHHGATACDPAEPRRGPTTRPAHPGGRPPDPRTQIVQQRCWELYYRDGMKMAVVLVRLSSEFGTRAPKDHSHVRANAKRYAKKNHIPLERKRR